MKVIADLCVVPLGVGVSVSEYIAACERVLRDTGLKIQLHAYGTNIEGEWDVVFAAIKRCHEVVHEMGAPRISTTLKFGTRTDRVQTMADKVKSVEEKILTPVSDSLKIREEKDEKNHSNRPCAGSDRAL
jgi:uncharacterized protein (TIGR00106 family)